MSYRRRKIGQALRRYREERNLTQEAAGRLVERSPASLSAYENGHRAIRPRDLRQILDHYGVGDEGERARLLELAVQGRKEGWWRDFHLSQEPVIVDVASLEEDASRIRSLETMAIPGLLQTESYTRAVFSSYSDVRDTKRDKDALAFRMARQRILKSPSPPQVTWILAEAVAHMLVGGAEVMKEQFRKILMGANAGRFELRVLPFSAGAHPGMDGSFSIIDVGTEDPMKVVCVHSLTRSWLIDEPPRIDRYEWAYEELSSLALSKTDSQILLKEIASTL
ncbi:helix-turn-helix transcriptional regulator [Actinomadura meridiana]|uniref:Helix-turn-helix transcriptional regulator n=1 Tax=Actinomadura meridiana TaxID=559626 RepID=A0ABP8BWF1_9ACTN